MSSENPGVQNQTVQEDHGVTAVDVLIAAGEGRKVWLTIAGVGSAASLAAAVLWPGTYIASTVLLPPQQQTSSAAAALAQLGAMGNMAGAATTGVKTPDDTYVALLRSRSVQDGVIERLELRKHYGEPSLEKTRQILGRHLAVSSDKKSGFITVEADDADPQFAARLANAHVPELQKLLTRLALTDAQQRRLFFEQQVSKTKEALTQAELKFRMAQADSGLVVTQALAESGVKESALLRSQIASREIELQTRQRFVTSEHPDVQRLTAELTAMRAQLARQEKGTGDKVEKEAGSTLAVQAFRDMKVQEALLEALIRQLELARADEAKEGPLLQQVDPAVPPEMAGKPKRKNIAGMGIALSVLLGFAVAVLTALNRRANGSWVRVRAAWR
jgi:tyrosine-protein kinase Etk/Wzc